MEIVQKKEWIEFRNLVIAESTLEMNAGAFNGRLTLPYGHDLSDLWHGFLHLHQIVCFNFLQKSMFLTGWHFPFMDRTSRSAIA